MSPHRNRTRHTRCEKASASDSALFLNADCKTFTRSSGKSLFFYLPAAVWQQFFRRNCHELRNRICADRLCHCLYTDVHDPEAPAHDLRRCRDPVRDRRKPRDLSGVPLFRDRRTLGDRLERTDDDLRHHGDRLSLPACRCSSAISSSPA